MPVDISWMREAANMPQMPSYAEQQQSRNALALQGMQLQKGKMDLEEAMRARQGLAQLTEQLRGLNINEDPEKYFTVVAQNLAASGHADKLPTVLEALEKVKNAKEIARLTEGFNAPSAAASPSAAPSAAGFSAVPPYLAAPQPAAAQPNMLAPSAAAAPSNALFKGKTREQWMDYAMNLTQRGSPLGKEIMNNMDVMFPQSKMGEMPELVKLQQYAAQLPSGSPDRRAIDARITELTSRAPRQPTEAEILLGVLPSGERVEAARAKLFGKPQQTVEEKAAEEKAIAQARKEGEAAAAAPEKAQKQALQRSMIEEMTGTVLGTIKEAKNLTGSLTTGYAGMLANLPNTEARQLKNRLETIKANLGFDRLQSMRDMSPTGGALGQVAVQELKYLQSSVASLDQLTDAKDLNAQLDKIERHYNNWLNAVKQSETTPAETPTGRAAPAEGEWKVVR